MVRLEVFFIDGVLELMPKFQFQNGTIRREIDINAQNKGVIFQFQNGTIRRK